LIHTIHEGCAVLLHVLIRGTNCGNSIYLILLIYQIFM